LVLDRYGTDTGSLYPHIQILHDRPNRSNDFSAYVTGRTLFFRRLRKRFKSRAFVDGSSNAVTYTGNRGSSRTPNLILDDLAHLAHPTHHGCDGAFLHRSSGCFRWRDPGETDLGTHLSAVLVLVCQLIKLEDRF